MAKSMIPQGSIHSHPPNYPWMNKETKTWWIGNKDTKEPYQGIKGDSIKGDSGPRGNNWINIVASTEVAPEDSIVGDFLLNSSSEPIEVAGKTVDKNEYLQILVVNPLTVTSVIGNLGGKDGEDGQGLPGASGNSVENRYAKNTSTTEPPTLSFLDRSPAGWSTGTINPSAGEYVWETRAYINEDDELVGSWSNQFRNTGVGQKGDSGPSIILMFDYDPTYPYYGGDDRIEMVKYNGQGYVTKKGAGTIPVGTLPTNAAYWDGPEPIDERLFVKVLVAYNAYVQSLIVGEVMTSDSGERFTAGHLPSSEGTDPTRFYSKHSPRGYYPSGRIMWTLTYISSSNPIIFEGKTYSNIGALIFYKDESGSPIHFIQSSSAVSGWVNMPITLVTSDISDPGGFTMPSEKIDSEGNYIPGPSTNAFFYDPGQVAENSSENFYRGFHTTQVKGMGNLVPDGWYHFTGQANIKLPNDPNESPLIGQYYTRFFRVKMGKITTNIWDTSGWNIWVEF